MRMKALAVAAVAVALSGCGADASSSSPSDPSTSTTSSPALPVPSTTAGRTVVATARKRGTIEVRPLAAGPPMAPIENPRHINNDPGGPELPVVLVVRQQHGPWLEVSLPVRPNGTVGLVPAADFDLSSHDYRITVSLSEFRLEAFRGDELIFQAPIGVAKETTPTPGGTYYTIELLQTPDPNGLYGPYAYGLSGFSDVHQSFNGGPGQLGIHGTNQPQLVGQRVSNGCIRLKNPDIVRLVELGPPLGTPVIVRS